MAADSASARLKEDFKEEFLTCAICTEPYDTAEHQAKFLPCLHSYCKSCLQQYAGKRPKFDCPKCRNEINVPGESVDSLPNNFVVENLMTYKDAVNFSISCGSCEEEGNHAVSFCHHCACFLCQSCVKMHRKMRPLQYHTISTMDELQKEKYNPTVQKHVFCKKHPKNELTMYCSEVTCEVPICSTCGLIDHRGHAMVELTTAIEEIARAVQLSCAKLTQRKEELIRKHEQIEASKDSLMDNFNRRKKDLQETKANLNNLMHAQCSKAHSRVQQIYQNKMKNMTKKVKSIDDLSTQITTACEFANDACDMSHPIQLLTSKKQILKRLHKLENAKLLETETPTADISFGVLHHLMMMLVRYFLIHLWRANAGVNFSSLIRRYRRKFSYGFKAGLLFLICVYLYLLASSASNNAEADANQCTIQLHQEKRIIENLNVGVQFKATLQAKDFYGQKITTGGANVEAMQPPLILPVKDNKDGTYEFHYYSFLKEIHVKVHGRPVKGSPFFVLQRADPNRSTIHLQDATPDYWYKKGTVQTVDYNGQQLHTGHTEVEVTQHGKSLYVNDNNDGTFTFKYSTQKHSVISVQIDGERMKGSPFFVRKQADPDQCEVLLQQGKRTFDGLNMGPLFKATLQTVDYYGNRLKTGGATVKATQLQFDLQVHDKHDGTYEFHYYQYFRDIHVSVNGKTLLDSPFFDRPQVDPSLCNLQCVIDKDSDDYRECTLQTLDSNGYFMIRGGASVDVEQCGRLFSSKLSVHDDEDGTYMFRYYRHSLCSLISVKINDIEMKGSPFDNP